MSRNLGRLAVQPALLASRSLAAQRAMKRIPFSEQIWSSRANWCSQLAAVFFSPAFWHLKNFAASAVVRVRTTAMLQNWYSLSQRSIEEQISATSTKSLLLA